MPDGGVGESESSEELWKRGQGWEVVATDYLACLLAMLERELEKR